MGENAISELYGLVRELKAEIAKQTAILERVDKELDDKEERIRELERESNKRKGVMAALSLFSSIVGGALVWLFKCFFGGHN